MTIFARDPDTGMAKWAYQMTPYDEWDYDGVNEMILADDMPIKGEAAQAAGAFRPQRLRLHAGSRHRRVAGRGEVRSGGQLGHQASTSTRPDLWPAAWCAKQLDRSKRRGRQHQGHLPGRSGHQGPAAVGLFAEDRPVLRADQPRLHGLRAVQGGLYRRSALCRRDADACIPPKGEDHLGNFIAWDATTGKIKWSLPEPFSVWTGALATAGDVVFYGTLEGYLKAVDAETGKELYKFKTPSGIIGNVNTYELDGKQYVAVLSGVGGWAGIGMAAGLTEDYRRPRRCRCLQGTVAATRRSAAP